VAERGQSVTVPQARTRQQLTPAMRRQQRSNWSRKRRRNLSLDQSSVGPKSPNWTCPERAPRPSHPRQHRPWPDFLTSPVILRERAESSDECGPSACDLVPCPVSRVPCPLSLVPRPVSRARCPVSAAPSPGQTVQLEPDTRLSSIPLVAPAKAQSVSFRAIRVATPWALGNSETSSVTAHAAQHVRPSARRACASFSCGRLSWRRCQPGVYGSRLQRHRTATAGSAQEH